MRSAIVLTLVVALLGSSPILRAEPAEAEEPPSLALVVHVVGRATVEADRSGHPFRLEILDRLTAGAVLETAADSAVTLVFFDGRRFRIGAASRVEVGAAGLEVEAGVARPLEPVPALAELPRLDPAEAPGQRLGAVRIRTARRPAGGLYPADGAAVLSDAARLFLPPAGGAVRRRVEIFDADGRELWAIDTTAEQVEVPRGVLRPGRFYQWRVGSGPQLRQQRRDSALFATLSAEHARAWRRLARTAVTADGQDLDLLLATVSHRLGMRREACSLLVRLAVESLVRSPGERRRLATALECGAAAPGELRALALPVLLPDPYEMLRRPNG